MTVLLSVVCGGAALFGAGKTWAEEKTRMNYNMHTIRGVWSRTTDAAVTALVWGLLALIALVLALGVVVGIAAALGANV
jgi:hypothetical protein